MAFLRIYCDNQKNNNGLQTPPMRNELEKIRSAMIANMREKRSLHTRSE
jgi:hypothetical protein